MGSCLSVPSEPSIGKEAQRLKIKYTREQKIAFKNKEREFYVSLIRYLEKDAYLRKSVLKAAAEGYNTVQCIIPLPIPEHLQIEQVHKMLEWYMRKRDLRFAVDEIQLVDADNCTRITIYL